MLSIVCSWMAPECCGSILPLQPNHMPPVSSSAACSATARPPARVSSGDATRLETTTRRLMCSHRLLPRPAQRHRRDDQADVRIGLREVAPGLAAVECKIFRQQPERIAPRQYPLEHLARLGLAPDRRQCLDVPEGADGEAGFRRAEIIRRDVAE